MSKMFKAPSGTQVRVRSVYTRARCQEGWQLMATVQRAILGSGHVGECRPCLVQHFIWDTCSPRRAVLGTWAL